jgi:O-methyltransferase involved in polyketide biosynthesis
MYLPEARVRSLLRELATATDSASWVVFSFMVEREDGAIGFEPRSTLVSWWLSTKDEPFCWSLDSARAERFARELGWSVTAHADSTVLAGLDTSTVGNRATVTGEEVIEATTTESRGTPTLSADSPSV